MKIRKKMLSGCKTYNRAEMQNNVHEFQRLVVPKMLSGCDT